MGAQRARSGGPWGSRACREPRPPSSLLALPPPLAVAVVGASKRWPAALAGSCRCHRRPQATTPADCHSPPCNRASKTALNIINKSLSIDLAGDNITCTLLHPGYVRALRRPLAQQPHLLKRGPRVVLARSPPTTAPTKGTASVAAVEGRQGWVGVGLVAA